ncbi:hypothetical protein, partial [Pseudomonas aeruginosa]
MKYPFSSRVIWGGILLLFSTAAAKTECNT